MSQARTPDDIERTSQLTRIFYRRQLAGGDTARVQIRFASSVLDRYVELGHWVKRTNTVGRVKASSWAIDFGIGESDATIHASAGDIAKLPEKERDHWAMHVAQNDLSEMFLRMLNNPGSCNDDGALRQWEPPAAS